MIADIIVDLQYGDCGKGKVAHHLCAENMYTHVLRYNGGCNAGHTIYHKGEKFVTHHIPCGVFYGIKSIIGPGCVVHPETFLKEVEDLESRGIGASSLVKIANNTHVVTDFHRAEDKKDEDIGTTKRGNGPCYRDKYGRLGVRANEIYELEPFMVDIYQEFHESDEEPVILCEGAQGFGLDIDWGDYPFVTSSHCTVGGAILNGIPATAVRSVWGVAKVYETYVGNKLFEGPDDVFESIRVAGEEFGSTTGRPRQVNWMEWETLTSAIKINGVTDVVFNKTDVLDEVGQWCIYSGFNAYHFDNGEDMQYWISENLKGLVKNVHFSGNKNRI